MKAWHFLADNGKLRDGRPAPADGVALVHKGPVIMCQRGLHASRRPLDALRYAPGGLVCRVECADIVDQEKDKLVCRSRTILWRLDASEVLRRFAGLCALDVVRLWDAPEVVVRFLKTGDETIRDAAWAAASAVARDAAWAVARDAAWAASCAVPRDAAWAAACAVARDAAWAAACAVARDAVWAASCAVPRDKQNQRLARLLLAAHKGEARHGV